MNDHDLIEVKAVPDGISPEALLSQSGWFLLAAVFRVLAPGDYSQYKLVFKQVELIAKDGQDPFPITGFRKHGKRALVRMERFAPWYENNPLFKLRGLEDLDFQRFISRDEGFFKLSEVCNTYRAQLPHGYNYIKRLAGTHAVPISKLGVFKYGKTYIVAQPYFGNWVRGQMK